MDNRIYRQHKNVIDLKELMWKLLAQWKAIVVVSLVVSVAICGLKYINDYKLYKYEVVAEKEAKEVAALPFDEQISRVLSSLTDSDAYEVNYVVTQKDLIDKQKKYLDESILNETDPTNQRMIAITYDVNAEAPEDLPSLMQSYRSFVKSDKFSEDIRDAISSDADAVYINELIHFEGFTETANQADYNNNSGSGALCFNIILPDESDATEVIKEVDASINDYCKTISKKQPNTISLAGDNETHTYYVNNVEKRTRVLQTTNTLANNVKNIESSLTEQQKAAIDAIMKIKQAEAQSKKTNKASAFVNNNNELSTEKQATPPKWNKKYALIGFLVGIILYAGVYVIWLIHRDRIISPLSIAEITDSRLLGDVYYERKKTGVEKLLHSKSVENYHYRGKGNIDIQVSKLTDTLAAVCKNANAKKITMFKIGERNPMPELVTGIYDAIVSKSKTNGVDIDIIDVTPDLDETILINSKEAVFAVGKDAEANQLDSMLRLLEEYDVNLLGSILVAEK